MAFFSSFVNQLESKAREVLQEGEKFLSDQPEDVPLNNFLSPPGEVKPQVAEEEEETRTPPPPELEESFSHNVSTLTDSTEAAPPVETALTREQQLFQEATKFQQEAQKYKSIIRKLKDKMDRDRQDVVMQTAKFEEEISRLELETKQMRDTTSAQVQECEERFGHQLQMIQQESNAERMRVGAGNELEVAALKQRVLELETSKPTIDMEAQLLQELEVERNRASAAELKQQKLVEEHALQLEALQLAQPKKNDNEVVLQELQRHISQLHLEREAERMQFELALKEQQQHALPSKQEIAAMETREKDLQAKLESKIELQEKELQARVEEYESKIALQETQLEAREKELLARLEDSEAKLALQETQLVSREQEFQAKLEESESKLTLQESSEQELKAKLEEYESKLSSQKSELMRREVELQANMEEHESKIASQNTHEQQLQAKLALQEARENELQAKVEEYESKIAQQEAHEEGREKELHAKLEECESKLAQQETQLEQREKELLECESKIAQQEAELEAIQASFQAQLETRRNESTVALGLEITELKTALDNAKLATKLVVAEKEQENAAIMQQLQAEIANKEREIFELKSVVHIKPIDDTNSITWQETINALVVDKEALCLEQRAAQLQFLGNMQVRQEELTQSVNVARNECEVAQSELVRLKQELATRARLIDELQSTNGQQEGALKDELDLVKSQLESAHGAHADAQQLALRFQSELDESKTELLAGKQTNVDLQCELEQCKLAHVALQHELETVLAAAAAPNQGDSEALEAQITALQAQINTDATMWALQQTELTMLRCELEKQIEAGSARENKLMESMGGLQQQMEENSKALGEAIAKCNAGQNEISALRASEAEHVAREIELNNAVHTLKSELQSNEASKELISKLEFELDALRTQFASTEQEFVQAVQKLEDSVVERNALQSTLHEMKTKVEQCETELALERKRVEALEMQSAQTQESSLLALENEFAEYRIKADAAFTNAMQETAEAEARVEIVKKQLSEELLAKHAAELDTVKQDAAHEVDLVKQEMEICQTTAQARLRELQQELESSKAVVAEENSTVQSRIAELEKELELAQQDSKRASAELAEQMASAQQQFEHLNAELAQKTTQLDALQLELVGATNQQRAEVERFEAMLQAQRDELLQAQRNAVETAAAVQPRRHEMKQVRTARASSMDILETGGLLPTTTARPAVVTPFQIDSSSSPPSLRSIPAQLQGAVMDVVSRGDFTGISRMKFTFGVLLYSVIVHLAMLGLYWRSCKEDMG